MRVFLVLIFLIAPYQHWASSSLILQNNTPIDLSVSVSQSGTQILTEGLEWSQLETQSRAWEKRLPLIETIRGQGLVAGETIYYEVNISDGVNVVSLKLRLQTLADSSVLSYSAEAPGWNFPWLTDHNFHNVDFNAFGLPLTLRFKPINTDEELEKDILFVIHDRTPDFGVVQSDLKDPNILNVLSYNIKIFPDLLPNGPLALERVAELPNHIDTSLDVVVFQEVFWDENIPGSTINAFDILVDRMASKGFQATGVLNPGIFGGAELKTNGGVAIFTRWPIVKEDDYKFPECDNNSGDCFARKGVKYAHINKLGTSYHIFGTHAEAGSNPNEIGIKKRQYKQMRNFVEAQNIPNDQAVVFAGDFNADYVSNSNNLYQSIRDSLRIIPPTRSGWPDSNPGNAVDGFVDGHDIYIRNSVIDFIFSVEDYRLPYSLNNHMFIYRSIDSTVWPIFDFGDHIPVHSRIIYPGYTTQPLSQTVCLGDSIRLEAPSNLLSNHQWFKDGVIISGATNNFYTIYNANLSDAGSFTCNTTYTYTHETNQTSTLITVPAEVTIIDANFIPTITLSQNTLVSSSFSGNQWYNQNGLINGATNNTYTPSVIGDYYVIVTLENCSTPPSDTISFTPTSNEEPLTKSEFVIYPNPVTNSCKVLFPDNINNVNIEIFSSSGQKLQEIFEFTQQQALDFSNMPMAIYFIRIWNGKSWYSFKISNIN